VRKGKRIGAEGVKVMRAMRGSKNETSCFRCRHVLLLIIALFMHDALTCVS
jgi:hypothetical protein